MELRDIELIFKALSDKQRLRIMNLLTKGPLVVNDLQQILSVSMSTVSQHLTVLRYAGLVEDDKQGRWVYYSIPDEVLEGKGLRARILRELLPETNKEKSLMQDRKDLEKLAKADDASGKPGRAVRRQPDKAGRRRTSTAKRSINSKASATTVRTVRISSRGSG